jgi:DNA-binding transcriptional MerR regulator
VSEGFKIGELASRCGVTRDTIRFYERAGLLPPPRRTASRHRLYDERAVQHVLFIRRAQDLGLTLADIRQLLAIRDYRSAPSLRKTSDILRRRLEALEERIAHVEGYRTRLAKALARISGSHAEPLPAVLGVLNHESRRSRRREA